MIGQELKKLKTLCCILQAKQNTSICWPDLTQRFLVFNLRIICLISFITFNNPRRWILLCHFIVKETEVQGGQGICLESHI